MSALPPEPHDTTPTVQARLAPAPSLGERLGNWLSLQGALLRQPRLESGWASLCGSSHGRNQDAVMAAPPFFAVADGVGGGKAGELASSQMLAWCRGIEPAVWRAPQRLAQRLREADAVLAGQLQALNPGGPSATTFAGAWLRPDGSGHIAHVGDVRILHWRTTPDGVAVRPLTEDQTYAALGETPPPGGSPGDPARMVGVGAVGQPPVQAVALREGEGLMLCSDGFHRFMPTPGMLALLAEPGLSLTRLAAALAHAAQQAGSRDDVSVLLLRRNPRWSARSAWWWALVAALALAGLVALGSAWRDRPGAAGTAPGADGAGAAPAMPASASDPGPPASSAVAPPPASAAPLAAAASAALADGAGAAIPAPAPAASNALPPARAASARLKVFEPPPPASRPARAASSPHRSP